jgi:O-acetyl-ADP-ribose deacetylase (regulator of RNase III)
LAHQRDDSHEDVAHAARGSARIARSLGGGITSSGLPAIGAGAAGLTNVGDAGPTIASELATTTTTAEDEVVFGEPA